MKIRFSNVRGQNNLHLEIDEQGQVGLSTWGYNGGGHYVGVNFYDMKKEEVLQAFAEAFTHEFAELIQNALSHYANHCRYCDRDLEFAPTIEGVAEWLEKELAKNSKEVR